MVAAFVFAGPQTINDNSYTSARVSLEPGVEKEVVPILAQAVRST